MSYKIEAGYHFSIQLKKLKKKYPSLRNDIALLTSELAANPNMGKPLGNHFYKIRLAIASKGKGKSGGGRVITFVMVSLITVYLAAIYDKSERENVTDKELANLATEIEKLM